MYRIYRKILFSAAAILPGTALAAQTARKPNVILLLADDLGYGDVSAFNPDSKIHTPNIDRLCRSGIMFTEAHSASAVSTPSRYGILTGRYAFRTKLKQGTLGGYSDPLIAPERRTLGTLFSKYGYSTACIGKWHLGWDWHYTDKKSREVDWTKPVGNGPVTRGFDYFYGISASLDMAPYVYVENDMPTAVPTRTAEEKKGLLLQRKGPQGDDFEHAGCLPNFTERAVSYIKEHTDSPFFLYVPFSAPHTPVLPSEEFMGKSGLNPYGDFVMMLDAMIGRIMDAVDQSGIADNTIIIFASDNGYAPYAGMKDLEKKGHHPSYIYRGTKSDLYDGGHHIPLIVSWNGKRAGTVEDGLTSLTDFYATFCEMLGHDMEADEGEDSFSFWPVIEGTGKSERRYIVHHSNEGRFSIRDNRWKLLFWPGSGGWSYPTDKDLKNMPDAPEFQLYDMKKDCGETHNLYGRGHKKKIEELTGTLRRYILDGRSTPGAVQKNDTGSEWEQTVFLFGK